MTVDTAPIKQALLDEDIPEEYICPISHSVMTDPVIIETGISYDRQCILDWFESGHNTCPITNCEVNPRVLISNLFLKNEIRKWVENNLGPNSLSLISQQAARTPRSPHQISDYAVPAENGMKEPTAELQRGNASEASVKDVRPVVQSLVLAQDKKTKKTAVAELFQLSSNSAYVEAIVAADALESLRRLLQEHSNTLNMLSASTLSNIAAYSDQYRQEIYKTGALPLLVHLLSSGQATVRAASCAAVKGLSVNTQLRVQIAAADGIRALLKLLKDSACRAKAAGALANLSLENKDNGREIARENSSIEQLIKLLKVKEDGCMLYVAATLEHLAEDPDLRPRFVRAGVIKSLVTMLSLEDDEYKAVAAGVLKHLCEDEDIAAKVTDVGVLEPVEVMLKSLNFYTQAAALALVRVLVIRSPIKDMLPSTSALPSLVSLLGHGSASICEGAAAAIMDLAHGSMPNQKNIADADAFPPLVQLVRSGNLACKTYGAAALNNLAANNPTNKDKVITANAIPALVGLLSVADNLARETAVRALLTLATEHTSGKVELARQGAIRPLVHLLRHSTIQHCTMYATLALLHLATDIPTNQVEIAEAGGVSCLVGVLSVEDEQCKFAAAAALAALASGTPANRKLIADAGAIPLLAKVVQLGFRTTDDAKTALKPAAAAAISYMALEFENKRSIAQTGVIMLLIKWLKYKQEKCVTACAAALWHLSLHDEFNKEYMIRAGAVPALQLVLEDISDLSCKMYAAGALASLQHNERMLLVVTRSGALQSLIKHYKTIQEDDYMGREAVASVLRKLVEIPGVGAELLKAGGGLVLVHLMQTGDGACQAHACRAVCALAMNDSLHELLLDLNVVSILVDLLRHGDVECVQEALWALQNLVVMRLAMGDARVTVQLSGAEEVLSDMVDSYKESVRELAVTLLNLLRDGEVPGGMNSCCSGNSMSSQ